MRHSVHAIGGLLTDSPRGGAQMKRQVIADCTSFKVRGAAAVENDFVTFGPATDSALSIAENK
jgi:hypothetical protein